MKAMEGHLYHQLTHKYTKLTTLDPTYGGMINYGNSVISSHKTKSKHNGNKKADNNKRFGNYGNNRGPNPNLHCTNCQKVGHTIDRCFDIIGYPPGNSVMCKTTLGWIIDSGANQHMAVSTLNMFGIIDILDLNLIVGHPNGTVEKIKYVRNLKLSEKIVLFDVLVVLEYCVSLLSVNKLIKDSRMFVGFTETKCFIQDLHLNKIVGTGSENGGLYMFDSVSPFSSNCQTIGNQSSVCYVSKSVWHTRLGHPSDQAIDMLHQDLNFTKD
nr:ribonuclease H-like domain-containing protein [Tanacetum cinerariifolium]